MVWSGLTPRSALIESSRITFTLKANRIGVMPIRFFISARRNRVMRESILAELRPAVLQFWHPSALIGVSRSLFKRSAISPAPWENLALGAAIVTVIHAATGSTNGTTR